MATCAWMQNKYVSTFGSSLPRSHHPQTFPSLFPLTPKGIYQIPPPLTTIHPLALFPTNSPRCFPSFFHTISLTMYAFAQHTTPHCCRCALCDKVSMVGILKCARVSHVDVSPCHSFTLWPFGAWVVALCHQQFQMRLPSQTVIFSGSGSASGSNTAHSHSKQNYFWRQWVC